jgi:hypothetical protein
MTFHRQRFSSLLQPVLLIVLVVGGLLIVQSLSIRAYQLGLLLVVGASLLEIGAGNIPPDATFRKSIAILIFSLVMVAIVFGLGIVLVPRLVAMGK